MAVCYYESGEVEKAVYLLEETLVVLERTQLNDRSETVSVMGRLANRYTMNDELEKAITIGERSFNLSKSQWGLDHRVTATQLASLASFYHSAGRLQEAVPMYEQALSLVENCLGRSHANSHSYGESGGCLLGHWGAEQAFEMLKKVLGIRIERLGPVHPDTLGPTHCKCSSFDRAVVRSDSTL